MQNDYPEVYFNLYSCTENDGRHSLVVEPSLFEGGAEEMAGEEGLPIHTELLNADIPTMLGEMNRLAYSWKDEQDGVIIRTVHKIDNETNTLVCPVCGGLECMKDVPIPEKAKADPWSGSKMGDVGGAAEAIARAFGKHGSYGKKPQPQPRKPPHPAMEGFWTTPLGKPKPHTLN